MQPITKVIIVILLVLSFVKENENTEEFNIDAEAEVSCRERTRLIGTDKNDLYELVITSVNETAQLECHFW